MHFLPDPELPCKTFVNQIKGEGYQKCGFLPGSRRLATDPNATECQRLHGFFHEPESALIDIMVTMRRAKKSIDVCVYLITLWDIQEILIALRNKRGIAVRMIVDSTQNEDQRTNNQALTLQKAGIEIKTNSKAMMHNKFMIVDKQIVFLGSTNWTASAFVKNDEALIKTRQPVIVQAFSDKFDLMWTKMSEYRGPSGDVRLNLVESN